MRHVRSAMEKIRTLPSVRVQQKRRWAEALTCYNQQNMYVVYDDVDRPLFWVQENTPACARNCIPQAECRPWVLDIHNIGPEGLPEGNHGVHFPKFLHVEKRCTCTCCCYDRPVAVVTELPSNRVLGTVRDPFACCNFAYEVFDAAGRERLQGSACCTQKGLCCPCPGCKAIFPVNESGNRRNVARLEKTWMWGDYCPACFPDWDRYEMHFGDAVNPESKMLLLTLTTFLQMRFFDRGSEGGGKNVCMDALCLC